MMGVIVLILKAESWRRWSRVSLSFHRYRLIRNRFVPVLTYSDWYKPVCSGSYQISHRFLYRFVSDFAGFCLLVLLFVANADDLDDYQIIQQMDDEIDIVMNEEMNADAGIDAYY